MWELDCEVGWAPKNWCFWTVVWEKTLESPLDCKEIQPIHSEGDQPWDFFGRNDAKAETPVFWPPQVKSWLIGKDSDAGRDWGQEEKGTPEDEMAGWQHWLDGRESQWTPRVGDGQEGLACCDSWGRKESDTTERLIWSDLSVLQSFFTLILTVTTLKFIGRLFCTNSSMYIFVFYWLESIYVSLAEILQKWCWVHLIVMHQDFLLLHYWQCVCDI